MGDAINIMEEAGRTNPFSLIHIQLNGKAVERKKCTLAKFHGRRNRKRNYRDGNFNQFRKLVDKKQDTTVLENKNNTINIYDHTSGDTRSVIVDTILSINDIPIR